MPRVSKIEKLDILLEISHIMCYTYIQAYLDIKTLIRAEMNTHYPSQYNLPTKILFLIVLLNFIFAINNIIYGYESKDSYCFRKIRDQETRGVTPEQIFRGPDMAVYREGVVSQLRESPRPGAKGKLTVYAFVIFNAEFSPRVQAQIERAVDNNKENLLLLTHDEISNVAFSRTIDDQEVKISLRSNAPDLILEESPKKTSVEFRELVSGKDVDRLRINISGMVRIKVGDKYLFMRYVKEKDNPDGSRVYVPIGGALYYLDEYREILEDMGATDFEGDSNAPRENDIRFMLPIEGLLRFERLVNQGKGVVLEPFREMREEMVDELEIFSSEEFEALFKPADTAGPVEDSGDYFKELISSN